MEVIANKCSKKYPIELNYQDIDKTVSLVFTLDNAKKLLSDLDAAIKEIEKQPTKSVPKKHSEPVSNEELSICKHRLLYGKDMRNEYGGYETIWTLPKGFEVEDNVRYRVWYTWRDSADSSDSSMYYKVHYIEEA